MYIARGITLIYTAGIPVINFPMPYRFLGEGNLGPIPWSFITFGVVALVVLLALKYMPIGRHLYAIGGNRQAAEVCGIAVNKVVIGVYLCSALLSGLAGIVLLGRVGSAQPTAGLGMELDSVATVLIGGASVAGGAGGVFPTIIGIFLLGLINNGLNLLGISGYYQFVLKGAIILIAVVVDNLKRRGR
jgi:ribose/xylose/arabinose/galactoside ABC-type transport system permease subunit